MEDGSARGDMIMATIMGTGAEEANIEERPRKRRVCEETER